MIKIKKLSCSPDFLIFVCIILFLSACSGLRDPEAVSSLSSSSCSAADCHPSIILKKSTPEHRAACPAISPETP